MQFEDLGQHFAHFICDFFLRKTSIQKVEEGFLSKRERFRLNPGFASSVVLVVLALAGEKISTHRHRCHLWHSWRRRSPIRSQVTD